MQILEFISIMGVSENQVKATLKKQVKNKQIKVSDARKALKSIKNEKIRNNQKP